MLTKFDFQPFYTNNLIRRGAKNDGGYLISEDAKANMLISFGLGGDCKFELDLVRYNHVSKFIVFDHTQNLAVYAKKLIKRVKVYNFKISVFIYRLIVLLKYSRDYIIKGNTHVQKRITNQGSVSQNNSLRTGVTTDISPNEIFDEFVGFPDVSVILKIDIERSEYDIIQKILDHRDQVTLLLIEFHDINDKTHIFENCISLLKNRFSLIHLHINNYGNIDENLIPGVGEFTSINKNNCHENRKVDRLPRVGLDSPSTPYRPDFEIDFTKV
jgi:hypothetical protein